MRSRSGISESLLANWRKDPAFDVAITSATALADAHHVAPRGQINGFGLRLLLRSDCLVYIDGTQAPATGHNAR